MPNGLSANASSHTVGQKPTQSPIMNTITQSQTENKKKKQKAEQC